MFLWQYLCPVCVSWCHYVTWKTNVENRMCWSCCLVFRLCFSPWQLLITRFSPQCAHAESSLYIPAEMLVLGLKEEPPGCKYFGTMCVSLLCMLRFLKPVLVMYWMPHKYAKYMMNLTPFFCNNTAVKQFWQVQVKLPNSLAPDANRWNVMCVKFQHESYPDPASVVGDLRLGPPHRAGPVLYAHFIHLMIKMTWNN